MAFILLSRDGIEVRLLNTVVFGTRQEALAALSRVGQVGDSHEVFVVDLDTATPVIIVPQQAASPDDVAPVDVAEQEPDETAGVWETPEVAEEIAEDGDAAEPPVPSDAPDMDIEDAADLLAPPMEEPIDLSDALRRAAGALESAGIVAPESISSAPDIDVSDDLETSEGARPTGPDEATSVFDLPELPVEDAIEPAEDAEQAPVEEQQPATAAWPWDVGSAGPDIESEDVSLETEPAEPVDADAPAIVDEQPVEYVPDPFEEPARDVEQYPQTDASDDVVALNRPVIMGVYDESGDHPDEDEATSPDAQAAAVEPHATADEAIEGDSEMVGLLADLEDIDEQDEEPPAYEPGGSDIAELTCDECVYMNTCPKKGESDPTSCGSFQWKSV